MAFEFGTNWSELSRMSGPIQGPLLSYETFTASFLEASFFGILLFGRPRVPPWPIVDELVERARAEGVDDLDFGPDPYDRPVPEALDEGTAGIGAMLAISSIVGIALAVGATIVGLNAIFNGG